MDSDRTGEAPGDCFTLGRPCPVETRERPVSSISLGDGSLLLDFGRAMFGTLEFRRSPGSPYAAAELVLGEALNGKGRVDRNPPGSIRSLEVRHEFTSGESVSRLVVPPDPRNTGPAAIPMPGDIGEVYPFRYVEIASAAGSGILECCRIAVHIPFDESAASFHSSDETLDAVWDLCRHSIKATSFCGVYVDGDRERIPYEGDAYINQLGHYAVDRHFDMGRYTHEYLCRYPTWPTEWQLHSVMTGWADYLYSGDSSSLSVFYNDLRVKTLMDLARRDGLISTDSKACTREFEERLHLYHSRYVFKHGLQDLVDWPPGSFTEGGTGERDNHEMCPVNSVVNAFHFHTLELMERIAGVLGKPEDAGMFRERAGKVRDSINRVFFDPARGLYIDGEGSKHSSLHSNMVMLAFGLVPDEQHRKVLDFVISRGMACSVYGAQYLLEALYLHGEAGAALELMRARHDRSWWNMIRSGSTVTTEAWDWKYKNNQDWNHAWGAVPANIISRFLLGVRPLEAGFSRAFILPQPGGLKQAGGHIPTVMGPVRIKLENRDDGIFRMELDIPEGMTAKTCIPFRVESLSAITMNGTQVKGRGESFYTIVGEFQAGLYRINAVQSESNSR